MTDKQKRFVEEYLIDLNATQACIRAGYKPKNACRIGPELLGKTCVREAVDKEMAKLSKRTGISQERVVRELAKIAFVNMTDIVDDRGRIKEGAPKEDLACIESIKYKESDNQFGESVEREVKIASKLKALELLGKHIGMFTDKLQVENIQPVIGGEDDLED